MKYLLDTDVANALLRRSSIKSKSALNSSAKIIASASPKSILPWFV
ncbi:hypothetical protein [Scytonema sp. PCC 10023]